MTEPTFSTSALKSTLIDARIINTKKLKVSGKDIIKDVKYTKDTRTEVTENDIWGSYVENDKGNVIIHDDYFESIILDEELKSKISRIEDNKIYIEENEEDIFYANIETGKIKKASEMLVDSNIKIFNSDLSSLVDGTAMFADAQIESFNSDLSSLICGLGMFTGSQIESFNSNLSSLVDGSTMFSGTKIESFESDLSSLNKGLGMFVNSLLKSFKSDLHNMTCGSTMFAGTQIESFESDLSSLVDGGVMFDTSCDCFSFRSYLPKLLSGYAMFVANDMDEESFIIIADGINDLVERGLAYREDGEKNWNYVEDDEKWSYFTYDGLGNSNEVIISSGIRGVIQFNLRSLDIYSEKFKKIFSYCEEISSKGWKVILRGNNSSDDIIIPSSDEGEMNKTPIPFYANPVKVNEMMGKYKDSNNDYYIIMGGHKIIGDDLSGYGMFLNEDDAALNMGLIKIEK
jgi:hypothetical protein